MVRSKRRERPANDDEFESMPEFFGQHFDRVHNLFDRETDDKGES